MRQINRWNAPLLLALTVGLGACGEGNATEGEAAAAEASGAEASFTRIINVEVMPIEVQPFRELIRLTGVVQANQDVTLSAQESGVIREILVDKGTQVREGQALFRIDDELIRGQLDQAQAQAALAQAPDSAYRRALAEMADYVIRRNL